MKEGICRILLCEKGVFSMASTSFILSCESTADLPFAHMRERDIPVLFYTYSADGREYEDNMGRDPQAMPRFYSLLKSGKMPVTSQINECRYREYFASLLEKGDVLHIAFGSGLSGSVGNAYRAAQSLREVYPDRHIMVVDSLCASSGYGLLVEEAADRRDAGWDMEALVVWLQQNRGRLHHQFYSTDLTCFRRSGRISGMAATAATILGICPLMRLDHRGRIVAYRKVRGRRAALAATLDEMAAHAEGGTAYAGRCFICHSDCLAQAEETRDALRRRFLHMQPPLIFDIGTTVAAHCGPGTVAVFFWGDERVRSE